MLKLFLVFVVAILAMTYYLGEKPSGESAQDRLAEQNAISRAQWAREDHQDQIEKIRLQKVFSEKGGFDNIMMLSATIENTNSFSIKDVVLQCDHFAPSGTKIATSSRTLYEQIGAKSVKPIKKFNMGFVHSQTQSSSCRVAEFSQ